MAWEDMNDLSVGDVVPEVDWDRYQTNIEYLHDNNPERATLWHEESLVTSGNALLTGVGTSQRYNTYTRQDPGADGDSFTQSFLMVAGSATMYVLGITNNGSGKIDWVIDGGTVETGQDWYTVASTYNVVKSVAVVLEGNGRHKLTGTINGKNASSGGYTLNLTKIWFVRSEDTEGVG